jgi:CRP-like cAMP-binding protein
MAGSVPAESLFGCCAPYRADTRTAGVHCQAEFKETVVHTAVTAPSADNLLLSSLPLRDRHRLLSRCEQVDLPFAEVLLPAGGRLHHVYFPCDSVIALGRVQPDGSSLEVALVGHDGMFGLPLVLGVGVSALRATVVTPGQALRLPAATFSLQLRGSAALRTGLRRHLLALLGQLSQAVVCASDHLLEARLARWLVLTRGRGERHEIHMTQEFLGQALGVRRASISEAAGALQKVGLIRYHRGTITVLDAAGLHTAACACLDSDRAGDAALTRARRERIPGAARGLDGLAVV